MSEHIYNVVPSPPDSRNLQFVAKLASVAPVVLPTSIDLRPQMSPVVDQGDLGCHDDQTEVLTQNGWKFFSELVPNDKLATVNPETQELLYEKPTQIFRYDYKGDMICGNHRFLDFKVTPNHRMLVRKWNEEKRTLENTYEFIEAQELGWYVGLLNRIKFNGIDQSDFYLLPGIEHKHKPQREESLISMSAWLKFLGIYLAEGTMLKEDQRKDTISYKIQIAGSKEREKVFIRETLKNIGISALELNDRFTFQNKRIYKAMEALGLKGVKAPQKFVPSFVFEQKEKYIKDFLLGHFMGDGSEQVNRSHYTSSEQLAEDIQRLIFLSGQESYIGIREARQSVMANGRTITGNYSMHRVSVDEAKNLSVDTKENIYKEYYEGEVFCAEVPSYHTLVTRRNNKILISGNSCTANAWVSGLREFLVLKAKQPLSQRLSRLFLYYEERKEENEIQEDSGANLKDGGDCLVNYGVCTEFLDPYNIATFTQAPSAAAIKEAVDYKVSKYMQITSLAAIKACLAQGYPVVMGMNVYNQMESDQAAQTGIVSCPRQGEQPLGGHAVTIVGYTDTKSWKGGGYLIVRNSWGTSWGLQGYFKIAYAYVTLGYAFEFWTAR